MGENLASWLEEQGGWELEIVERDREARGFEVAGPLLVKMGSTSWRFLRYYTRTS